MAPTRSRAKLIGWKPALKIGAAGDERVKIDEAAVPTLEDNNELIRRYTRAVFDEGDVAAVDEYLAPDFYNQSAEGLAHYQGH
jgi:hypothetical protein